MQGGGREVSPLACKGACKPGTFNLQKLLPFAPLQRQHKPPEAARLGLVEQDVQCHSNKVPDEAGAAAAGSGSSGSRDPKVAPDTLLSLPLAQCSINPGALAAWLNAVSLTQTK